VFRSVGHLKDAIQPFLDAWNDNCHRFAWVKSADTILVHLNIESYFECSALAACY
jgi:hypothetical protein